MTDLDHILAGSGIEWAGTIPSLGWADSPPMVVMPYLDAEELIALIRGDTSLEQLCELVSRAGAMLAAYHHAHPLDDETARNQARSATIAMGAKLPGGSRRASALIGELDLNRFARSYGDVTPGNFLAATDGRLLLIDPPIDPRPELIHRDLGYFLFEMRKHFAGRGRTRTPARAGYDTARVAFLEGYAVPLTDADQRLIALYEARQAAGTMRNRFPGRPADTMWFAARAVAAGSRFLWM
jgi:hypothetical protein